MRNLKRQDNKNNNKYYMYGKHAVLAATHNPNRIIHKIYCLQKTFTELGVQLKNFDTEIVTSDFITKKIGQDQPHQGIIAYVNSIFLSDLEQLDYSHKNDRIAILDQITDPQNIGAIIRSAAAFGINKLLIPSDNSPDENASIAKAACGCLELISIVKVINLKSSIDKLKKKGFWIAGLETQGESTIENITNIDKLAIIIGSEGKGMRKLTRDSCDFLVKIDISPLVESLNASNAASIIFHATQI